MMMAITVALMFGPCFPILYAICFVHLVVQYITQRLVLFYWVRQPPAIDEAMTNICAQILRIQTMAILFVAFWQLSNLQIFYNEVPATLHYKDELKKSKHTFLGSIQKLDLFAPNFLPFVLLFFVAGYYILKMVVNFLEFICCCSCGSNAEEDQGGEGLMPFYQALK